jgi:hypothetical protein
MILCVHASGRPHQKIFLAYKQQQGMHAPYHAAVASCSFVGNCSPICTIHCCFAMIALSFVHQHCRCLHHTSTLPPSLLPASCLAVCCCCCSWCCLLLLQELSRTAAAAGLPGADSWTSPGEWAPLWTAITKVRLAMCPMKIAPDVKP